jgi:hypothetical protein
MNLYSLALPVNGMPNQIILAHTHIRCDNPSPIVVDPSNLFCGRSMSLDRYGLHFARRWLFHTL